MILAYSLSCQASKWFNHSPNAIIRLFTIFVTVSSRPTPVKEDLAITARQFDPMKALHKRETSQLVLEFS